MSKLLFNDRTIEKRIFFIRNKQVMLDSDLAQLYEVSTSRLNEQVKRNKERFPDDFMFRLTTCEWNNLKSQNATSSWGGRRKLPYVFTEQGISTLSGVLKSKTAIKVNIAIMRTFVKMRHFLISNANLFQRLEKIEFKQIQTDNKVEKIISTIENKKINPTQGVFFDGQVFDAYKFVTDLIKSSKKSIVLIDNYIDETILVMFSKNPNVKIKIFTKSISKQVALDVKKYNAQYPKIELIEFSKSHDRFLIIDDVDVYHFGASLKDLGKKWFAFSKFKIDSFKILEKLNIK